jgi:hypothetical protein
VDIKRVARSADGCIDKWLPLTGVSDGLSVHVRAQWRPFPARDAVQAAEPLGANPSLPAHEPSPARTPSVVLDPRLSRRSLRAGVDPGPAVGVLLVHLHSASGLIAMDYGGTSDPYATLNVNGLQQKSRVISKTCDPQWEEKFRFFVRDLDADTLRIALWDFDQIGQHDALGQISFPVIDLAVRQTTHGTYPLCPPENGRGVRANYGEITLTVHWRELVKGAELLPPDLPVSPERKPRTSL